MRVRFRVKLFRRRLEVRPWSVRALLGQLIMALFATLLSSTPNAFAAAPVISTSTTIVNGALDPSILVNSTNFVTDLNKFAFTVDAGTTGLTFDSAALISSSRARLNLRGTAQAGSISVQANISAFMPVADSPSNTLTVTVPNPLIEQKITFDALTPMRVSDSGQILSASSTSGLDISFSSRTPNTCRIVSQKINPIAAGTCSIKASQNGNSSYRAAPDIIQSFTISPAASGVVEIPATNSPTVTTFASLEYSPDAASTTYKDITISSRGIGQIGATKLKLLVPSQATKSPAVFLFSSYSTDSENDQGFFVVAVKLVDKSGLAINHIEKAYKINMPKGYFYSEIFWSSDGLTWQRIPETINETSPTNTHTAFFREVDGSVSILTDELGLFGYRFPQEDLKVLSPAQTLALNGQLQLDFSGGSGTGAVTFGTSTALVCTVTLDGVVSAKQAGKCFVFVRKYAAQHFIDAVSSKTILTIEKSELTGKSPDALPLPKLRCDILSYSLSGGATTVEAVFCPKSAGKMATLYVRSKASTRNWVDKKIATAIIDSNGYAAFQVTRAIAASKFLHVFVGGKHWI